LACLLISFIKNNESQKDNATLIIIFPIFLLLQLPIRMIGVEWKVWP